MSAASDDKIARLAREKLRPREPLQGQVVKPLNDQNGQATRRLLSPI
jgi:hypothetical protein